MLRPYSKSFTSNFKRRMIWPVGSGLPLYFLNLTNCDISTEYTSRTIAINAAGALTITGGTFSINGAAYTTTGTVAIGDKVRLKATSSASYETAVDVVLSVDAVEYDTWSITTMSESAWTDKQYFSDGDYWTD